MGLLEKMPELESAEDFLVFFSVPYNPEKVKVIRIHLLKRFGAYKRVVDDKYPQATEKGKMDLYSRAMARAYEDSLSMGADRLFPKSGSHCSTCGGGAGRSFDDGGV